MNLVPYEPRAKYPHMGKEDATVWRRFIDTHPNQYKQVAYDVRVGVGHAPPPDMDEKYKLMQQALSQKRIDVVGFTPGAATIIEVKPYASLGAVGQVLVYAHLFKRNSLRRLRIDQLIVCEQYDADITDFCSKHKIEVITI